MRDLIRLIESSEAAPETPWHEIETGKPAMIYAWRGVNGTSTPLSDRWKLKLKRNYLLGDGVYAAPTKLMAQRFGDPVQCRMIVENPYVFYQASANTFLNFDLDQCRRDHDSIVIKEGRAVGNEDLRQVCVFAPYAGQIEIDIAPPILKTLQPGAKVHVTANFTSDFARQQYGHLSGMVGTIKSITMGHPNVMIKGKRYFLSKQDVEII